MEPNQILTEIYNMLKKARDGLDLAQKALLYDSAKSLELAHEVIKEISRKEQLISGDIKDLVRKNPAAISYLTIRDHLIKIKEHMQGVLSYLNEKIVKKVLFNDQSVSEINFLLEKVAEVLNNTSDLVLAKNTIILGYVTEAEISLTKSADRYEIVQEEQLIEGVGPTLPSTLFVNLLKALRSVAWHSARIAENLFKLTA